MWAALGQPKTYLEPFFGSGAVLLLRPDFQPGVHIETVCDKDGFLSNCWRSIQFSPDETARWCDWPVIHCDLSARKRELIKNEGQLLDGLSADPKWHDPVMAGYWIWAASCWIGSGLTALGQRPHVGNSGMGVHALGKRPHVSNGGKGVHALGQIPHVSNETADPTAPYNTNIYAWLRRLSERLRYVRVVCGDWTRICGGKWQDKGGDAGIFFDPPYSHDVGRDEGIYHEESATVAKAVAEWAVERGEQAAYRIVLAGYYEEHEWLLARGWTVKRWKAQGGYANVRRDVNEETQGAANRHREALFFSPHCLARRRIGKQRMIA